MVKAIATGLTLATARKTLTSRQVVAILVGAAAETSILRRTPSEVEKWHLVVWGVCPVLNWSALTGQSEETGEKVAEVEQQ
jgi:hypothetical protein